MKKILSLTLCLLLCTLTALPLVSVSALEEPAVYRNKDYIFEVTDTNEISILYYIGTENTVTVPAEICGLPVKSIEKWAFFGTDVQKVTVSEGVTVIKEEAFYNCQSLENVTLPSTLESTGTAIFRFCQNLKNVTFAGTDSSPELGEYLFYACNTLESVNIPSEVTSIPKGMFAYCQSLNNLTLPEKTEEISDYAFYNSGLETITLPGTLNSIGERAFADCTTLDEINNLNENAVIMIQTIYNPQETYLHETYAYATDLINSKFYKYDEEQPGEIIIVDVASALNGDYDNFAADAIHPSVKGNELIAQAYVDVLKEQGLGENTELVITEKGQDQPMLLMLRFMFDPYAILFTIIAKVLAIFGM